MALGTIFVQTRQQPSVALPPALNQEPPSDSVFAVFLRGHLNALAPVHVFDLTFLGEERINMDQLFGNTMPQKAMQMSENFWTR